MTPQSSAPWALLIALSLLLASCSHAWADPLCEQRRPRGEKVATLSDDAIDESSGLAASWLDDEILWTHNDSGDEPRLWALRKDGQVLTELKLPSAEAIDWEDMAIGPCEPGGQKPCLYIADTGDNLVKRETVTIYRVPEPDLGEDPPKLLTIDEVEVLEFRYEGGPRDAEALLVHPTTAQIWVIEKTGQQPAKVFSVPAIFDADEVQEATPIAALDIPGALPILRLITAADISPDATQFTLRTYLEIYTFCASGDDFETAFHAEPVKTVVNPAMIQGESVTYDRKDWSLWLTSEQLPAPLVRIPPPTDAEPSVEDDEEDEEEDDDNDPDEDDDPPSNDEDNIDETDDDLESARSSGCSTSGPIKINHNLLLFTGLFGALFLTRKRLASINDG